MCHHGAHELVPELECWFRRINYAPKVFVLKDVWKTKDRFVIADKNDVHSCLSHKQANHPSVQPDATCFVGEDGARRLNGVKTRLAYCVRWATIKRRAPFLAP